MMIKPNNYIVINMMSSGRLHIQIGMFIVTIKYGVRSAIVRPLVPQKVPSEANPKVRNHGEGPY